jgi:hypothetical protein
VYVCVSRGAGGKGGKGEKGGKGGKGGVQRWARDAMSRLPGMIWEIGVSQTRDPMT